MLAGPRQRVLVPEHQAAPAALRDGLAARLMRGALAVQGVSKSYRGHEAVRDVTLDVAPGEFLTLLGPSGCGKTTLLRLIAGFERPDAGTLAISGERRDGACRPTSGRSTRSSSTTRSSRTATVAGNVAFGLEMAGRAGGRDRGAGGAGARAGAPRRASASAPHRPALRRAEAARGARARARARAGACCCSTSRWRRST